MEKVPLIPFVKEIFASRGKEIKFVSIPETGCDSYFFITHIVSQNKTEYFISGVFSVVQIVY